MASAVDVCNDALTLLGDDRIISLTDDTTQARVMNQLYQPTVDAVLRSYPWRCAIAQAQLARLSSTTPLYGFSYAYQLPTDPKALRVLEVYNSSNVSQRDHQWAKFGDKIYSDLETVYITYVAQIVANGFDPLLRQAVAARLAADAAWPLTQNSTLVGNMNQLYAAKLNEARTVDRLEGQGQMLHAHQFESVRY